MKNTLHPKFKMGAKAGAVAAGLLTLLNAIDVTQLTGTEGSIVTGAIVLLGVFLGKERTA